MDNGSNVIEECRDDFALLIEAGFVAVKQLDEVSARRLFQAAQILHPDSSAPRIGIGYIALNKLEMKEATKIFEEINAKEPENHLAATFLGICYVLSKPKRKKGEQMLDTISKASDDPTIKHLCELSLVWAEKDLSKKDLGKSKAPFFANASQADAPKEKKKKSS